MADVIERSSEPSASVSIRDATSDDLDQIVDVLNALITTTTFEYTEVPDSVVSRTPWFEHQRARGFPVLVAETSGEIAGWATYGDFRDSIARPGFRFTVEHTVHVAERWWGTGVRRSLMDALVERARLAGVHVMIGAIDASNVGSIRFHERLGFVESARMPEVGHKFDRWLDLVFVQRIITEDALAERSGAPSRPDRGEANVGPSRGLGTISPGRREAALATKGFMPPDEGDALHAAALAAAVAVPGAPWVEVGSYCGRSTIWLGDAAERAGTVLYAIDHHRGSEENQAGWEHHDADVLDPETGLIDTLPFFRRAIHTARLDGTVVAVVGRSPVIARQWSTPLALVFIDGGHGELPAREDYLGWSQHVAVGGTLAIHDVFPDPADGGRPPYEQIYVPAIESGRFEPAATTGSLRVLTRVR